MAFRFTTTQLTAPLRALLGYMRGDDIRAANARTLARNRTELADEAADSAFRRPAAGPPGAAPTAPAPAMSAPTPRAPAQ